MGRTRKGSTAGRGPGGSKRLAKTERSGGGAVYVALLRAINVGGKNMVPMGRLREVFEEVGCRGVRTYINSGNVVFEASPAVAKRVAREVEKRIEAELGVRSPVVVRTAEEMARAGVAHHLAKGPIAADDKTLYVAFLADEPSADRLAKLDAKRSPGDEFVVRGREIYVRLAMGAAETKLTVAYFDSVLGTVSTFRNWRTVGKLVGMCGDSCHLR